MTTESVQTQILSYKYRIYPNRAQSEALGEMLRNFCDLYNACLQQRIEAWRRASKGLSYFDQCKELKAVRDKCPEFSRWAYDAERQVMRRLQKSFDAFFRRVKRGETPGYPRFRASSRFHSADFRVGAGLSIKKSNRLTVVGVPGEIKVKWHRELPSNPKSAILTRSLGKWYVVFAVEVACAEQVEGSSVGIDLGLTDLCALSTGEMIKRPNFTKAHARGLRRRQRELARAKQGSKRRAKARQRLAVYQRCVANRRRHFTHKISRNLADRFARIAFEDLNIKGLARGMLAKDVNDALWAQIIAMTTYKAANAGSIVVCVDPRSTSQECPDCGQIAKKTLAQRMHICDCGCRMPRDTASAIVIHDRAFGHGTCLRTPSQRVAA